jgi:hypothetical protein
VAINSTLLMDLHKRYFRLAPRQCRRSGQVFLARQWLQERGEILRALARDWPRGRKYKLELKAVIVGCILPDENSERGLSLRQ